MKVFFLFVILALPLWTQGQSFVFGLSGLVNYNVSTYNITDVEGTFDVARDNVNLGIEFPVSWYISPSDGLFIGSGLRLNHANTTVSAVNTLPGFTSDPGLYTIYKYYMLTAPLYIGKSFSRMDRPRFVSLYGGTSLGIIAIAGYAKHTGARESGTGIVTSGYTTPLFYDKMGNRFLATLDAGIDIAPFKELSGLSFGLKFSHNLNHTPIVYFDGFLYYGRTRSIYQVFSLNMTQRYSNIMFLVTYSFGKKWKHKNEVQKRYNDPH